MRPKGVMWGRVTQFCNFATHNISGSFEPRNFKFGTETDDSEF